MGAFRQWLDGAAQAARREVRELAGSPAEIVFCLFFPVMWLLVVWGLLGEGVMTRLPTGFVDNDNTSVSRAIGRALNASRAVALVSHTGLEPAMRAMRQGSLYGIVTIPPGYTRDMLSGRGSSVSLYLDETRFAVAATLQLEVSSVISALGQERTFNTALRTGNGVAGAKRLVNVVHSSFFAIGNQQGSFLAFLGGALMPGVVMLGAMLGFVTSLVREDWRGAHAAWLAAAGGLPSAAVAGKLAPHYCLYCLVFLFYMALFAGQGGFAPAGSLVVWFCLGAACIAVFSAMAILVCALAPNWRTALVIASGYAAPALPFTGFSIPLDSMTEYVRAFSLFLPITWLVEGQAQQWTLNAGLSGMGPTFAALGALFLAPLAPGLCLFARKLRKTAAKGNPAP